MTYERGWCLRVCGGIALWILGCSDPVTLIVVPDGGASDAPIARPPPVTETCEIDPTFTDLGSPLFGDRLFHSFAQAVAIHGGTIAVASFGEVLLTDGIEWRPLPNEGLPAAHALSIAFFDETWWVSLEAEDPAIYAYDQGAARWEPRGTPGESFFPVELIPFGEHLLVLSSDGLFALEGEGSWRAMELDGFVFDTVATSRFVYASVTRVGGDRVIVRSSDLEAWTVVPHDASRIEAVDLAAAGDIVLAFPGLGGAGGYHRLDERGEPSFVAVDTGSDPVPTWIAEDGTVMSRRSGDIAFAPSLGAGWVSSPGLAPFADSTGLAFFWRIASEGSTIVLSTQVSGGNRVLASRDHGRTFAPPASARSAAPILEAATDGETYLLRVRGDDGDHRLFVHGEDGFVDRTALLRDRAIAGVTGIDGAFVTRPAEYSDTAPQISFDGGLAWTPLSSGYPIYDTNAGSGVRVATGFARDPDERLYVSTIGGITSLCCDGTKTPWDYRPGSGVWRLTVDEWSPLNAGIPVEYGPPPSGGPPFRSDVLSIASTEAGMFAVLLGRGVYTLVGDRWRATGVGLPLDRDVSLLPFEDTAIAWSEDGVFVRDGDLWTEGARVGIPSSVATRADLVVVASDEGLFVSSDGAATFGALDAVDDPVLVTATRDRLYVTDRSNRVHVAAITCEGP
jgi:hypothetical protein